MEICACPVLKLNQAKKEKRTICRIVTGYFRLSILIGHHSRQKKRGPDFCFIQRAQSVFDTAKRSLLLVFSLQPAGKQ